MAEAWYADFNHLRRRRRPYYGGGGGNRFFPLNTPFNGPFGYSSSTRVRRRPLPRPFYPNPYFGYNAPHEDYRFETDFLDPSAVYGGSRPTKTKAPTIDSTSTDYNSNGGSVDSEISQYYDPSSATYHVGTGYKTYDGSSSSGSSGYYSGGKGGSGSSGTGIGVAGSGTGVAYDYTTDSDDGYKFTTVKVKGKGTRSPTKSKNTRYKYNTYTPDNDGYKYSSDTSGYGSLGSDDHSIDGDDSNSSTDSDLYGPPKYNSYPSHPTKNNVVYQTAPKSPKSKPTTKTTTYTPPIKISDSSIDILTKPLGSATFNLNLSPGTVYQPPSINYSPIGTSYKPIQPAIQPIPIQPPATSYGRS